MNVEKLRKVIFLIILSVCAVGCEKLEIEKYQCELKPFFKHQHDRFVPVPGGWLSVSINDKTLEFITNSGDRYLFPHNTGAEK